jgi:hypothetical protein
VVHYFPLYRAGELSGRSHSYIDSSRQSVLDVVVRRTSETEFFFQQ